MSDITIINPNDLRTLISDNLDEKLKVMSMWLETNLILDDKPLTANEAMKYLSMSRSTFYRYVEKGLIPQYALGDRSYYKKSELDSQLIRIN